MEIGEQEKNSLWEFFFFPLFAICCDGSLTLFRSTFKRLNIIRSSYSFENRENTDRISSFSFREARGFDPENEISTLPPQWKHWRCLWGTSLCPKWGVRSCAVECAGFISTLREPAAALTKLQLCQVRMRLSPRKYK